MRFFWSDALRSLFEVSPTQTQVTYAMYRTLIHPEDWPRVEENIKAHLEGRADGDEYHVVHRIVTPNGTEKWIEAWGAVLRDETGVPVRMLGTAVAITEAMKMKAALQESEERFRTVVEQASDAIFVHDLEGNFLLVNKMACEKYGVFSGYAAVDAGGAGGCRPEGGWGDAAAVGCVGTKIASYN